MGNEVLVTRVAAYAPGGDEHKGVTHLPRPSDGGYGPGLGRSPTASWSSSQQSEDEVDVAARLA